MAIPKTESGLEPDRPVLGGLAQRLEEGGYVHWSAESPRNSALRPFLERPLDRTLLDELTHLLGEKGALRINWEERRWVDADGEQRTVTLARAAETSLWPMGTHYWVRDNALIGARLLALDVPELEPGDEGKRLGRELVFSAATILSSRAQLRRFERLIRNPRRAAERPKAWPHIFLSIEENLSAGRIEPWMHIQDAWQITATALLAGIRAGVIDPGELTAKHRMFLGLLVPFLSRIRYFECPNAGSWEELTAVRTSVIAWEVATLALLLELWSAGALPFLESEFNARKALLLKRYSRMSFPAAVERLLEEGAAVLESQLPFESPLAGKDDPRYREADAALLYLLFLDTPALIAEVRGLGAPWKATQRAALWEQIESLVDPRSGAICRYRRDSYQREGYFRPTTVAALRALSGGPSGDASGREAFVARDRVVPAGREAAWTHFVWQSATAAGIEFLRDGTPESLDRHRRFLQHGIRLFTGEGEWTLLPTEYGTELVPVPAWRMPECYISDRAPDGALLLFPSPHTPLNWSVGEATLAFRVARSIVSGS